AIDSYAACRAGAETRFTARAASLGRRTFHASPHVSISRISRYDGSNCHQNSPWRADVGKAWWLLCQPSPRLSSATAALLALWSPLAKGREPQTWQAGVELPGTRCDKE